MFFVIELAQPTTYNILTKDMITDFLGIPRKSKLLKQIKIIDYLSQFQTSVAFHIETIGIFTFPCLYSKLLLQRNLTFDLKPTNFQYRQRVIIIRPIHTN